MSIYIIKGKKEQRAAHWNEIRSRVTTHEGELLSGTKGKEYQRRWSKKYLGKDLGSRPEVTVDRVDHYEKFEENKR